MFEYCSLEDGVLGLGKMRWRLPCIRFEMAHRETKKGRPATGCGPDARKTEKGRDRPEIAIRGRGSTCLHIPHSDTIPLRIHLIHLSPQPPSLPLLSLQTWLGLCKVYTRGLLFLITPA